MKRDIKYPKKYQQDIDIFDPANDGGFNADKQRRLDLFLERSEEFGSPTYNATAEFPSPIYEDAYQAAIDYQRDMLMSPKGQEMLRDATKIKRLFFPKRRNEKRFQDALAARLANLDYAENALLFAPQVGEDAYGIAYPDGPDTVVLTQDLRGVPYTVPNMYSPEDLMFTMVHEVDHVEKGDNYHAGKGNMNDANLTVQEHKAVRDRNFKLYDILDKMENIGRLYETSTGMTKEDFLSNFKNKKKGEKAYYYGGFGSDRVEGHVPLYDLYQLEWAEQPDEIASQVSELQYLGKMTGIYDPFTEDFNESHLREFEKLARQGKMPKTLLRTLMNLEGLYEEDKLINLMNSISQNDSEPQQNTMNYAKQGGAIKYQQPTSKKFVNPHSDIIDLSVYESDMSLEESRAQKCPEGKAFSRITGQCEPIERLKEIYHDIGYRDRTSSEGILQYRPGRGNLTLNNAMQKAYGDYIGNVGFGRDLYETLYHVGSQTKGVLNRIANDPIFDFQQGGTMKYQQGAQTPVMPEGKTVVALVNGEQKPIGVVESSSGNNITMRDFSGNIVSLTPTVGNKYTSTDAFFNQSLLGPSSAVSNDFPIMIAQNGGAFTLQKFSTGGTSKSSFPDLSGDGEVTQKDILIGRGVIKQQNAMNSYPAYQMPPDMQNQQSSVAQMQQELSDYLQSGSATVEGVYELLTSYGVPQEQIEALIAELSGGQQQNATFAAGGVFSKAPMPGVATSSMTRIDDDGVYYSPQTGYTIIEDPNFGNRQNV